MSLQIGQPKYASSEKLTYYKLGMKDGQRDLILRIAPPIKSLAEDGHYAVYLKQHFGYNMTGRGDKTFPIPFSCIERRDRNKNIVQECPECNEIALRKAALEARKAKGKTDGLTDDQIAAQNRPAIDWLKSHNCDKKWTLLAKNQSGAWGFLSLGHNAYTDLQREIKYLQGLGFEDPLGTEAGHWFHFNRVGNNFNDLTDTCKAVQERNGATFTYKTDALNQSDFAALEALPELTTLGRKISYEQITMLVESGGDAEVVKSVFDSAQKGRETSSVPTSQPTSRVETPSTVTTPASAAGATTSAPVEAPKAPGQEALLAQMEALKAQLAAMSASTNSKPVATQPAPTPTMVKQLDMDPDQFLAEFGAD
jgi:hypothetical protein